MQPTIEAIQRKTAKQHYIGHLIFLTVTNSLFPVTLILKHT